MKSYLTHCRILSISMTDIEATFRRGVSHTVTRGKAPVARVRDIEAVVKLLYKGHKLLEYGTWSCATAASEEAAAVAAKLTIAAESEAEVRVDAVLIERSVLLDPPDRNSNIISYYSDGELAEALATMPKHQSHTTTVPGVWSSRVSAAKNQAMVEAATSLYTDGGRHVWSCMDEVRQSFDLLAVAAQAPALNAN